MSIRTIFVAALLASSSIVSAVPVPFFGLFEHKHVTGTGVSGFPAPTGGFPPFPTGTGVPSGFSYGLVPTGVFPSGHHHAHPTGPAPTGVAPSFSKRAHVPTGVPTGTAPFHHHHHPSGTGFSGFPAPTGSFSGVKAVEGAAKPSGSFTKTAPHFHPSGTGKPHHHHYSGSAAPYPTAHA